MDEKYVKLFTELCRTTAVLAEQVMDYDKSKDDEKGFESAKALRDDFERLHDRIDADDFDGNLTKAEYAKLLVGCYIITNQLQDKITILKKSLDGYQTSLIPKLQKILDASDEEYAEVAKVNLVIESNE